MEPISCSLVCVTDRALLLQRKSFAFLIRFRIGHIRPDPKLHSTYLVKGLFNRASSFDLRRREELSVCRMKKNKNVRKKFRSNES